MNIISIQTRHMLKGWMNLALQYLLLLIIAISSIQFASAKDRIRYHIAGPDGSTLRTVDEQGITVAAYRYSPFGEQLQSKKPANLKDQVGFVGGIHEQPDLVYLKQRYYNPTIGRFYQPDPVTFLEKGAGQINRYQYGWNDPFRFKDSSGLSVEPEPDTNVIMPWVFGTMVHGVFASQLNNSGQDWMGNVSYNIFGQTFKPDGVQTSLFDINYNIVELKHISYRDNDYLYKQASHQLWTYKVVAEITMGRSLDESQFFGLKKVSIGGNLPVYSFTMPYIDGYWYNITFDLRTTVTNGLAYYSKERGNKMTTHERKQYTTVAAMTAAGAAAAVIASRGRVGVPGRAVVAP